MKKIILRGIVIAVFLVSCSENNKINEIETTLEDTVNVENTLLNNNDSKLDDNTENNVDISQINRLIEKGETYGIFVGMTDDGGDLGSLMEISDFDNNIIHIYPSSDNNEMERGANYEIEWETREWFFEPAGELITTTTATKITKLFNDNDEVDEENTEQITSSDNEAKDEDISTSTSINEKDKTEKVTKTYTIQDIQKDAKKGADAYCKALHSPQATQEAIDNSEEWQKIMKELKKKYKGDDLMSFMGEYGILIRECSAHLYQE